MILLQLKDEYRNKFDVNKAWDRFNQLKGHPYGFHVFLFTGIDTIDQNIPSYLSVEIVVWIINISQIYNKFYDLFDLVIVSGLNMRLGTQGVKPFGIVQELVNRYNDSNKGLKWLIAIPENSSWEYPEPQGGVQRVCSNFVADILSSAGVFDNIQFEPTEVSPYDLYLLNIWNTDPNLTIKSCPIDSRFYGYCQLNGVIEMDLYD